MEGGGWDVVRAGVYTLWFFVPWWLEVFGLDLGFVWRWSGVGEVHRGGEQVGELVLLCHGSVGGLKICLCSWSSSHRDGATL